MGTIREFVSSKVTRAVSVKLSLEEVKKLRTIKSFYFSPNMAHTLRLLIRDKYAIITSGRKELKNGTSSD